MRTCLSCCFANSDEAEFCAKCGARVSPQSSDLNFNDPISKSAKRRFWLAAWIGVILTVLLIKPSYVLSAPFFPVGLFAWLPNGENKAIWAWFLIFPMFIGWPIYFFLTMIMFRTQKRATFIVTYVIFCILLALNVGGCQHILKSVSGIQ
jgi:hypothetical protein